jgi:hypothetical protein
MIVRERNKTEERPEGQDKRPPLADGYPFVCTSDSQEVDDFAGGSFLQVTVLVKPCRRLHGG